MGPRGHGKDLGFVVMSVRAGATGSGEWHWGQHRGREAPHSGAVGQGPNRKKNKSFVTLKPWTTRECKGMEGESERGIFEEGRLKELTPHWIPALFSEDGWGAAF